MIELYKIYLILYSPGRPLDLQTILNGLIFPQPIRVLHRQQSLQKTTVVQDQMLRRPQRQPTGQITFPKHHDEHENEKNFL